MIGSLWLWLFLGATAGIGHAWALWRTAQQWRHSPLRGVWRLPAVVMLLVGAAVAGRLFPAIGGWAGGLTGTSTWFLLRRGR
jgi:hypothetical protein